MLYKTPVFRIMGDRSVLVEFGDDISAQVNVKVRELFWGLDDLKIKGLIEQINNGGGIKK